MNFSAAQRVFKTSKFSKDAKKGSIADIELCEAIAQVLAGQADDLGGGVFKKRLNSNMYRAIILAKGGAYWVYEYLFAKKDQGNIQADELAGFRMLAKGYAALTPAQLNRLLTDKDLTEICHDHQAKI